MKPETQNCEDIDIDLNRFIGIFVRRKKTFLAVFSVSILICIGYILTVTKIYSVTVMIQPPVIGEF